MIRNFIKENGFECYYDASLKEYNTYKIDIKCKYLIFPKNRDELALLIKYLKESNIKHRIELEYYTTKRHINEFEENEKDSYGIEIIKKEYIDNEIGIETGIKQQVSDNAKKIIEIIDTLKRYKVTPIGLNDVLEDLLKAN